MRRRTPCPCRRAGAGPCPRCCPRRRPCPLPARRASTRDGRPYPSARSTARRPARATEPCGPGPSPGPVRLTTRDSARRKPPRRPGGCEKVASTRCPSGLAIRTFDKSYLPSSEGHSRYPAPSIAPPPVGGSRLRAGGPSLAERLMEPRCGGVIRAGGRYEEPQQRVNQDAGAHHRQGDEPDAPQQGICVGVLGQPAAYAAQHLVGGAAPEVRV